MRTLYLAPLFALALSACDGGSGGTGTSNGAVRLGLENARQSAPAGVAAYPKPVYAKLSRSQSAAAPGWSFVAVAYADTIQTGAPAPGWFVCVSDEGNGAPQVSDGNICKRTDAAGNAAFTFKPGTRTGEYAYPVCMREHDSDPCPVRDSVHLTVTPREPTRTTLAVGRVETVGTSGFDGRLNLPAVWFVDDAGEPTAWRVVGSGFLVAAGDTAGTGAGRALIAIGDTASVRAGDSATLRFVTATRTLGVATAVVRSRAIGAGGRLELSLGVRPDTLYLPTRP